MVASDSTTPGALGGTRTPSPQLHPSASPATQIPLPGSSVAAPRGTPHPTQATAQAAATAPALETDPVTGADVSVDTEDRVRKRLGEAGTLTAADGAAPDFSITLSPPPRLGSCTMRGFGTTLTPEHGSFVRVHVKATLSSTSAGRSVGLGADAFVPVDSDGRAVAASAWSASAESCEVSPVLDQMALDGEAAEGNLILDLPPTTAAIAFDIDGSKGWTWPLRR